MGRIDFVSRIKNFRPDTVSHCLQKLYVINKTFSIHDR